VNGKQLAVGSGQQHNVALAHRGFLELDPSASLQHHHFAGGQAEGRNRQKESGSDHSADNPHYPFQF
jgi:hypothetical protein